MQFVLIPIHRIISKKAVQRDAAGWPDGDFLRKWTERKPVSDFRRYGERLFPQTGFPYNRGTGENHPE